MSQTIPEWAKPLVAARERGATLQYLYDGNWEDECDGFSFCDRQPNYRIKPGTDPGERTADPLIFGASIPGNEPVPVRGEYVPLTIAQAWALWEHCRSMDVPQTVSYIHSAGWAQREEP